MIHKGLVILSIIIWCFVVPSATHSQEVYRTQYVGEIAVGDNILMLYLNSDDSGQIQYHAYTLQANSGDIITIDFMKSDSPPEEQLSLNIIKLENLSTALPAPGSVFNDRYDASQIVIWTGERMNDPGHMVLKNWNVPETGTYVLFFGFYPYIRGPYNLEVTGDTQATGGVTNSTAETGWQGEFPIDENGDYEIERGPIEYGKPWSAHTLTANGGDIITAIVIGYRDTDHQQLVPEAQLYAGGWDQDTNELPQSFCVAVDLACTLNYRVPDDAPDDSLFTLIISGANYGDYYLWARVISQDYADLDYASGLTGELFQQEGGAYNFSGNLPDDRAVTVHSMFVDPGQSLLATVTSDTIFLQPVLMLVPGGYNTHEDWWAFDVGDGERAQLVFTVPDDVPPQSLVTFVIADSANLSYLLLGNDPDYGFGGEYDLQVLVGD